MLAGRLPSGFNELCTRHPPPRASPRGGTGESFLGWFFFAHLQSRKRDSLPPKALARHRVMEQGGEHSQFYRGQWASPRLSPAHSSVPPFNSPCSPKPPLPSLLCKTPCLEIQNSATVMWWQTGSAFLHSPSAPALHRECLPGSPQAPMGILDGSQQPHCTSKNPQLSNCLFFMTQWAP